jgi:acyl-coenzyme A thioesterase PaaI-like protein
VINGRYFEIVAETATAGRYRAGPGTGGPWRAGFQHGGPPGALLVRAAERAVPAETGELVAVRAAFEFVGPVPVGEVEVDARVVRAARSAVLVEASMSAADRLCLQARVWLVRRTDTTRLTAPLPDPVTVPRDLPDVGGAFPYHDTIDWQTLRGSLREPGPGTTWARPRYALVGDESLSGLQRVVLIADSASGISAVLDWNEWSFLNVDLDVHLARPVDGEWILVDAETSVGTAGSALARSTISDVRGNLGATLQTLIVLPR